ncbi:hypothetical protein Zmor_020188 [Zophobas morio]|uniref:Uncharacterized protein n=1 Tax=Zophobas morio TaxID=2755281 RepID=A0AA38I3S0_9CUCU|nr:hypothetical protein Zmor_020188 [Zophobas morio]
MRQTSSKVTIFMLRRPIIPATFLRRRGFESPTVIEHAAHRVIAVGSAIFRATSTDNIDDSRSADGLGQFGAADFTRPTWRGRLGAADLARAILAQSQLGAGTFWRKPSWRE